MLLLEHNHWLRGKIQLKYNLTDMKTITIKYPVLNP